MNIFFPSGSTTTASSLRISSLQMLRKFFDAFSVNVSLLRREQRNNIVQLCNMLLFICWSEAILGGRSTSHGGGRSKRDGIPSERLSEMHYAIYIIDAESEFRTRGEI